MSSMPLKRLAVVYATKGGMGDVGKFAGALATADTTLEARIVSLSRDRAEGDGDGIGEVDVTDAAQRTRLVADLSGVNIAHADVDDADATSRILDGAIAGADAVVACVGSRQPKFGRWVSRGTQAIAAAMARHGVSRLVVLSSMGIGEDFIRNSGIRRMWGFMLASVLRGVRNDLMAMESAVKESGLDYLFVRPVGLTPGEPPKEDCVVLEKGVNEVDINVAKSDVARFMVREAISPTLSRTAVTFASPLKTKNER
eukprot:IDg16433t1